MKIGIIGLSQAGKTTIFNALTGAEVDLGYGGVKKDANLSVAQVPDPRLDYLTEVFKPRRQVNALVEYVDVGGLVPGAARSEGYSPEFLSHIKGTDALLLVARDFAAEEVLHPEGSVDAARDILNALNEFLFSDLAILEGRLERLSKQVMKVRDPELLREKALLEKCRETLEAEKPLREMDLTPAEEKILRSFSFLTLKPLLVVINIHEARLGESGAIAARIREKVGEAVPLLPICGKVEAEIAGLPPGDAAEFLEEYGLSAPARDVIINASYDLLGYISFFTVGEDECRAWTITRGTPAPQAAGVIHSDLERGFIRAEVVHYDDFRKAGSLAEARHRGLLRLEGKEYIVQDGDIINVRFNV